MRNKNKLAIRAILKFKRDFDRIDPKIPRKLVGEIGEFYAMQRLIDKGFLPEHRGGQGGYDIHLADINKRIEVRTSLLKNEGIFLDQTMRFYGWRVQNRNQKKRQKFDYLIGVALDDKFLKPKFYIFTYKEAFSVGDVLIGRFNNVKKKISLFENKTTFKKALKQKPKFVTKFERYINRNPKRFLEKWGKIALDKKC